MASRASLPAKEFESWQTATGWSYSAHGLLACLALRAVLKPVTSYMHDYMHGVLQGCMPVAMYVVMEALRVAGLKSWQGMQDWCRLWFLPKAHKFAMDKLFEAKRVDAHRKAERFKAPASEILELYTVMRQYVLRIGSKAASAAAACKAFLDVCFLLDLLLAANTGKVTGDMLDQAAAQVLSSFRAAGCEEYTIKKFHWNFHYGDSLSHHNCLINCFACERKHRQVVRHGELIFNTKNYEDSVYRELLCSQLHKLHQPLQPQVDLVKHSKGPEKLKSFLQSIWTLHSMGLLQPHNTCTTCSAVHVPAGVLHRSDFVLATKLGQGWQCGEIWCNFAIDQRPCVLLGLCSLLSRNDAEGTALWKEDNAPVLLPAEDLICAVQYSRTRDGLLTLIPWHLR
eukprot:s6410_g1.t1